MSHRIAVISFPGTNCEAEMLRSLNASGLQAIFFRWNQDPGLLTTYDGYVLPGGFSYEDRGRAGMIAARDTIMHTIKEEAAKGKPVLGICNGAQILVESGLIPNAKGIEMCLATNAVEGEGTGFLSQWVWIKTACKKNRCLTSRLGHPIHIPIAHNEGRWTTTDPELLQRLRKQDQIACIHCDENGVEKEAPNGSLAEIAGLCNPEGNVVALMPHPERTPNGKPFFDAIKLWMDNPNLTRTDATNSVEHLSVGIQTRNPVSQEVFIDTIITNNEERTIEQAAKATHPNISLKQYRYLVLEQNINDALRNLSLFNPNKEIAYVRKEQTWSKWDPERKKLEPSSSILYDKINLLRRDSPDTGIDTSIGLVETGICYSITGITDDDLSDLSIKTVFANPHASSLERLE